MHSSITQREIGGGSQENTKVPIPKLVPPSLVIVEYRNYLPVGNIETERGVTTRRT